MLLLKRVFTEKILIFEVEMQKLKNVIEIFYFDFNLTEIKIEFENLVWMESIPS